MVYDLLFENPWPLYYGLAIVVVVLFVFFWMTQLVKYLVGAIVGLVLITAVTCCDWWVVTDIEQVDGVIQDLAVAVQKSDTDRVLSHFDMPQSRNPVFSFLNNSIGYGILKSQIKTALDQYQFDFVNVSKLQIDIRPQSRTAKAEFKVFASANAKNPGAGGRMGAGTLNSGWVLHLREVSPGVWKVISVAPTNEREATEVMRYVGAS